MGFVLLWRGYALRNDIPELLVLPSMNHFFQMTVFKLVGLFRGEVVGQDDFLDNGAFNHRLGQFPLKKRVDVSQLELARQALSDLLHVGVHAAIAAFADIAQHAIDMDGVDVGAFRHWRVYLWAFEPALDVHMTNATFLHLSCAQQPGGFLEDCECCSHKLHWPAP
jgi:hypothetical protein